MSTVRRYVDTLRHLKVQQLLGRLLVYPRRLIAVNLAGATVTSPAPLPAVMLSLARDPWNNHADIATGIFTFLEEQRNLGRPVSWNPDASLLWRFNLHYFDYLCLLSPDERDEICLDWIRANPPAATSVAWHPYPTSLRILNWCRAASVNPSVVSSLAQQTEYLSRAVESHILGNHLLENARALVVAGKYFGLMGSAKRWFDIGLEIFLKQTPQQILQDGAHFERSPMYHSIVLAGYLDVVAALGPNSEYFNYFRDIATRMVGFLRGMTRPHGGLAQFSDTAQEIPPPSALLIEYARNVGVECCNVPFFFPHAGYYRLTSADGVDVVIDGGRIGPDYIPAHAHADIFSYECSFGGKEFVADTGVFGYSAGPHRDFARSTAAHSTVEVDGVSQAEVWSSFRVARRYHPHDVSVSQEAGTNRFEGSFSGYSKLLGDGIVHRRCVDVGAKSLRVQDTVTGAGSHRITSRITLHPDVAVEQRGSVLQLERDGTNVVLVVESGSICIENGWYAPRFGFRRNRRVIALSYSGPLPVTISYRFEIG